MKRPKCDTARAERSFAGLPICTPSAAATAGAVYGSITGGTGFFIACVRCCSWIMSSSNFQGEHWDVEATRPLLERENGADRADVSTAVTAPFSQLNQRENVVGPTRERLQADVNPLMEVVLNLMANQIQQQRSRADTGRTRTRYLRLR